MMFKRWILWTGLPLLVGLVLILMLLPASLMWAQSDDKPDNVLYLPLTSQPSEPTNRDTADVTSYQLGEAQLYLDQANSNSAERGTADNPFREFTDAANVVSSGGNIAILPGTYRAVGVLSKPMTLEAPQGSVTINYTTDTDGDGLDDNWEQALAEMYRPIMLFDKDEGRWPSSARWFTQYSYLRPSGGQQIYSQAELYNNPTLVLRAHEREYESSDLRRNPNPAESFHIDISGEGDPYCGEGALNGCRDGSKPDHNRLPYIPIYVVVHRLLQDIEPNSAIDTTGLYLLHFEYGFAYNAISGGAHEGDWERLEVYVDSNVDPFNGSDEHRSQMLRGIKYYHHKEKDCPPHLTLPGDSDFPYSDGIPQVYVETGQHAFFSKPLPNLITTCWLIRDADGDGEQYRVEKVVNLGEQFTRIVRLGESIEEIEDRNIALFFNGAFGERKSPGASDGVESPGRRIPSLPRPEPDLSQFYVTPPFSEESPGFMQCPSGSALKGIRCSGSYCDNMELICQSYLAGSDNQAFLEWKGLISEEAPNNSFRTTTGFLSGLGCEGRYCDNVKLEVLTTPHLQNAGQCVAEPFVSEEDGAAICWDGKFVAGLTCNGSYCDKLSIHCCSVKP